MTVGQTHQLGKIIGPSDASVKWDSQNKNVATVDSNGKITALSAGTTIISIAVSKFQITETSAFTLTVTENYENPEICPLVINNAIYYIKNLSGKYLDVYNGNTTDGTRLLQYNFSGSENQRFKIQHISGAEYKIIPQNATNKVLSVNGSKHVVLETENGSSCQRWYIFNRNGNVQIVNKQYNQCPLEISSTDNYVCVGNTTNYDTWQLEVQSYPLELFGVEQVKISHLQTENGYHLYIYILKNNKTSEYTALINSSSNEEFEVYNINEETKEKMDAAWAGYSNGTYENNSFEEYCGGARLALDYGNLKLPSNISRTSDEYYAAWLYVTGLNEKAYEQFINDLPYVVTGIVLTFATISITFYALDNMAYNAAVNTSQVLNQNQTNQIASKVSEKIGTYSSSTLNRVLQMCIRNPSSKNVVLGMSESTNPYYKVAETLKFNHFFTNQWDKLVSQYGRHFMDIVNMHYLELQKARDCIFYLSSDPNSKTITHGFAMEIQWLIQQGYHFTKTIIDGIELWIATK